MSQRNGFDKNNGKNNDKDKDKSTSGSTSSSSSSTSSSTSSPHSSPRSKPTSSPVSSSTSRPTSSPISSSTKFSKPEDEFNDGDLGKLGGTTSKVTPWYGHLHVKRGIRFVAAALAPKVAEKKPEEAPVDLITLAELRLQEQKKLFEGILSDNEYQLTLPLSKEDVLALFEAGSSVPSNRSAASLPGAVQVLPVTSAGLDIRTTMHNFEEDRSAKSVVSGQDIILYLGQSGTGKTANIKELLGCEFEPLAGKLRTISYPAMLKSLIEQEDKVISTSESQTSKFTAYDLSAPEIVKRIDYKLKKPVYVCDAGGFGDTNTLKTIDNTLDIITEVRGAASVRIVVLFDTFLAIGERGGQLRLTIHSLARILRDVSSYTDAIRYEFSRKPNKEFKVTLLRNIQELLKVTGVNQCTPDEKALLEHMYKQISPNNSKTIFAPTDKGLFSDHCPPHKRMEKNMALKPITEPKLAFRAYVEKATQPLLERALANTFTLLDDQLVALRKNVNDGSEESKKDSIGRLSSVFEKMEELKFIDEHLRDYDTEKFFKQSMDKIIKACAFLKEQAASILDVKKSEITVDDIKQYHHIEIMYACLHSFFTFFYQVPAPADLPKNIMRQIADEYCNGLRAKLNKYNEIHKVDFEHSIGQQLLGFVEKLKPGVDTSYHGLPATLLVKSDELAEGRINRTLDELEVTELDYLNVEVDCFALHLAKLEKECGDKDIKVLKRLMKNLTLVEKAFAIEPVIRLESYFQDTADVLKKYFREALNLHDFQTAITVYNKISELADEVKINVAELKSEFDVALQRLIPSVASYTNLRGELELTEEVTKRFIYVMRIAADADRDVAKAIHLQLEGLKPLYTAKLKTILDKDHDVSGVNAIAAPLQQLIYALSIYEKVNKALLNTFESSYQDIKAFVLGFSQRYAALLSVHVSKLPDAQVKYAEMAQYLTSLEAHAWVGQLVLDEQTSVLLLGKLGERFEALTKRLQVTDLSIGSHDNFGDVIWVFDELFVARNIKNKLVQVIPDKLVGILEAGIEDFNERVTEELDEIIAVCNDQHEFEKLTLDQKDEYSKYIGACTTSKVLTDKTREATGALVGATHQFTQAKEANLEAILNQLVGWQDATNRGALDSVDVDKAIAQIIYIFNELIALEKRLPQYYQRCNDPLKRCSALLAANLESFDKQFKTASDNLINSIANDTLAVDGTGVKFGQMVSLCNQLTALDKLLPVSANPKPATYSTLHEAMNAVASTNFTAIMTDTMTSVRNGDYSTVITIADSIGDGLVVKTILCEKVSKEVGNLANTVTSLLDVLVKSKSSNPGDLDEVIKKIGLLKKADVLLSAGMLDDTTDEKRNDVLKRAQKSINKWLQNCEESISKSIDEFEIKNVLTEINQLEATIGSMPVKPENWEATIKQLSSAFNRRVQAVVAIFNQPTPVWAKEKRSLADICQELQEAHAAFSHKNYDADWKEISKAAMQGVTTTCDQLNRDIDSGRIAAEKVITDLKHIEAQVAMMPRGDTTSLKEQVVACCKQTMKVLFDKIDQDVVSSFDSCLKQIRQIMVLNDGTSSLFSGLDLSQVLAPLHDEARKLADAIKGMCGTLSLPKQELERFVEIHNQTAQFDGVIVSEFDTNARILGQFIEETIANLNTALAGYQASNDATLLPSILKACSDLKDINLLSKKFDGKNDFSKMLPINFSTDVNNSFKKLLEILDKNKDAYSKAFSKNHVQKLKESLDFVRDWKDIVNEVALYIDASTVPSIGKELVELKEHHNTYNMKHFAGKILEKIEEMMKQAGMDATGYLGIAEKSAKEMEEHFANVKETSTFIKKCEVIKDYLGENEYTKSFVDAVSKYAQDIFILALKQLPSNIKDNDKEMWEKFNNYHKVLSAFAVSCKGDANLENIMLDVLVSGDTVKGVYAADYLMKCVSVVMEDNYTAALAVVMAGKDNIEDNLTFMYALQRIADNVTAESKRAKTLLTEFLKLLLEEHNANYLELISTNLRKDGFTEGQNIIKQQACFTGLSIAIRNAQANKKTKNDILDELKTRKGKGQVEEVDEDEKALLLEAYDEFAEIYENLISTDKYLTQEVDFKSFLSEFDQFLAKDPIQRVDGKILWDDKLTNKIPKTLAYLFALWTLRGADAYFNDKGEATDQMFLKKPTAGQVIAILRQLGVGSGAEDLESHLAQILTGEGKSIVNAVTAETLAIFGYDIEHACYSKYLSSRDYDDFKDMFKQLGIDEHIKYGTFNTFIEEYLNSGGDLRELAKNIIEGKKVAVKVKKGDREVIILIDEVDVFFNREFSGSFFNPDLIYNNENVTKLINAIWDWHRAGDKASLRNVKDSDEYKACVNQYPKWTSLFEGETTKMIAALDKYQSDDNDYEIANGEIVYKYLDSSDTIDLGYQKLWSYFHEVKVEKNKDLENAFEKNTGINVSCGNFSYKAMFGEKEKKCILGVTGALKDISKPALEVIVDDIGIKEQTFIPSTYITQRNINSKVTSVPRKDLNDTLAQMLRIRQKGFSTKKIVRPVIPCFTNPDDLTTFRDSEQIKEFGSNIGFMTRTSSSSQEARNKEVDDVTGVARITLAEIEKVRGNDTVCTNDTINLDGGPHLALVGWAANKNDEIQAFGRIARNGFPGTGEIIVIEEDLVNMYGLSLAQVHRIRDSDDAYEQLDKLRIAKFEADTRSDNEKIKRAMEVLHKPSLACRDAMHASGNSDADLQKAEELLLKINQVSLTGEVQESRTAIIIDTTGSMGASIEAVKATVCGAIYDVHAVLKEHNIPSNKFAFDAISHTSYDSPVNRLFTHSGWTNEPYKIAQHVNTFYSGNGHGRESGECALKHLLVEHAETGKGATQALLITDISYSTASDIHVQEGYMRGHPEMARLMRANRKPYETAIETAEELCPQLAAAGIKLFGLFVPTHFSAGSANRDDFMALPKMAAPGGEAIEFDPVNNPAKANADLKDILVTRALKDVSRGNDALQRSLLDTYAKTKHSASR